MTMTSFGSLKRSFPCLSVPQEVISCPLSLSLDPSFQIFALGHVYRDPRPFSFALLVDADQVDSGTLQGRAIQDGFEQAGELEQGLVEADIRWVAIEDEPHFAEAERQKGAVDAPGRIDAIAHGKSVVF